MKPTVLILLMAASVAAASAQTHQKPATSTARTATRPAARTSSRLPAGIPPVHGVIHTAFSLKYQEIKIGTGPLAEPNKIYHVQYTGYIAATGVKFDSSYDHRPPVMKDGKPVLGPDGKPELGEPIPLVFPQGFGRLIPGFDQGFAGMHVGGKRRIFVPWQLGYGTREIPAHGPEHPAIPAKSDLIFDVELLSVTDMPTMTRPPMGGIHPMPIHPGAGAQPGHPGAEPAAKPGAPATQTVPATAAKPAAPATQAQPQSK